LKRAEEPEGRKKKVGGAEMGGRAREREGMNGGGRAPGRVWDEAGREVFEKSRPSEGGGEKRRRRRPGPETARTVLKTGGDQRSRERGGDLEKPPDAGDDGVEIWHSKQ
jgi:hypothetical protein